MFTKQKAVRQGNLRVTQYKKIIDWEAVGGALFLGFIILVAVASCAG